jgi:OOP family OmpA-OmpF porin
MGVSPFYKEIFAMHTPQSHAPSRGRSLGALKSASLRHTAGLLLGITTLATCGLTLAQNNTSSTGGTSSGSGLSMNNMRVPGSSYMGLSAGSADLSRPITGLGNWGGGNQSGAYGLYLGNYFNNQNYGFEVGYTDFGSVNRSGGNTKVDGINLSLIGRMPLNPNFNLLGKIGTTYSRTDVSASAGSGVTTGSERGFGWSYGVGAEYLLNTNWSGVLQYDEHYVKYPGTTERVSATTLGLRYRY